MIVNGCSAVLFPGGENDERSWPAAITACQCQASRVAAKAEAAWAEAVGGEAEAEGECAPLRVRSSVTNVRGINETPTPPTVQSKTLLNITDAAFNN